MQTEPVGPANSANFSWTTVGKFTLARLEIAVILAALISVPLTIVEVNGQEGLSFQIADWVIWAVFAIEFMLALTLADNRQRYLTRAWLSLLVVVISFPLLPSVFAFARLARLVRLLRLVRL